MASLRDWEIDPPDDLNPEDEYEQLLIPGYDTETVYDKQTRIERRLELRFE